MCGIFAYLGNKNNAGEIILEGLKSLEYRGYDSWGITVKLNKKLKIEKQIGKIGEAKISLPNSTLGIGHTRWATHGGVTVQNAHPHLDCHKEIAVIHNGIIENFTELKKELIQKGHKFLSETDTEVISHLIEEYLKKGGLASSVRDTFNRLKGLSAIVVAYAPSKEIIAVKNGSPLVIGKGKNELFIASDIAGILKHTNNIYFLEDQEMIILGEKVKLLKLPNGNQIEPRFQKITWNFESSEKGKFKHFYLKEIHEQPKIIKNTALYSLEGTKKLANLIHKAYGTFMIACGSASYAALAGTYIFSSLAKKHVNFTIGSEFKYIEDFVKNNTLLIPISQSGESIDVIEPVTRVKNQKGSKIASILNVLGSTLYRISDFKLLLNAGPEKCVIATKSFTTMVSVLLLTAYTLAKQQKQGQKLLLQASENVKKILKKSNVLKIKQVAKNLKNKEHIFLIGRGLSYATALEATLKLKESTYIHAEGFAAGELKHGVIALIDKGTPCIVFAPADETYDEIISNAQEIKARGGHIIGIGPKENPVFDEFLITGDLKEATIIPQIVTIQLLAYHLALLKGIKDPDKPRNLAKSVTVK
ncbi:glutamine--fructose-6-phosphate transaminase (isomerizing) [Candidatus Parcubacteria bacterium]|nr:MAG: glutamine--fructose-6-phosphate transaminase (isomerizing) [Candidatus Parcubacteria bacterium]